MPMQSRYSPVAWLMAAMIGAAVYGTAANGAAANAQPPQPPRAVLTLSGPPSVVSFPLFRMIDGGMLSAWARRVDFQLWSNGGQLRSSVARADAEFIALPSHMPANLTVRGEPVKLLAISAWGVHWLVSSDPNVRRFEDIRGQELVVPLRHEMPGILIDELLRAQGGADAANIDIRAVRDFPAAVNLLLSGKARHALLVEPSVSAVLARARAEGGPALHRVESIREVWARYFPDQPDVPQAGLAATAKVAGDAPLRAAAIRAYAEAARWCQAQVQACAELAHRYLPAIPVEALRDAIKHSPLEVRPASAIRPQLEAFYRLLLSRAPALIGGRLPDAGFYQP